jgi:hypothetical protein
VKRRHQARDLLVGRLGNPSESVHVARDDGGAVAQAHLLLEREEVVGWRWGAEGGAGLVSQEGAQLRVHGRERLGRDWVLVVLLHVERPLKAPLKLLKLVQVEG